MKKLYYKNKILIKLSKIFENRRLFTPLQLSIYTLRDFQMWPERLIALDAFCQTGLQWTRIFARHCEYLEMWDIDAEALKFAKKEFPEARICCGDSIAAFKNKTFHRNDFNFVLIDSPVPFQFPDGTFEHFGFFNDIFNCTADQCVIIFDVVPDIRKMLSLHPNSEQFVQNWASARSAFYEESSGTVISPAVMLQSYTKKIEALGFKVPYITYNARNQFFGFITLVIKK